MASELGVLDFLVPSLRFNVQSAVLTRPFWTSSCLPSASTSNLPQLLVPFGLPRAFPPLQRPIRRACSSLLDFSIPSLCFNVQSAILSRPFWTSSCRLSASTSNPPHLPHQSDSLWSIGKRERRSSRFLTPFFLWTRGESNPCPKTHSLFFYYHS